MSEGGGREATVAAERYEALLEVGALWGKVAEVEAELAAACVESAAALSRDGRELAEVQELC